MPEQLHIYRCSKGIDLGHGRPLSSNSHSRVSRQQPVVVTFAMASVGDWSLFSNGVFNPVFKARRESDLPFDDGVETSISGLPSRVIREGNKGRYRADLGRLCSAVMNRISEAFGVNLVMEGSGVTHAHAYGHLAHSSLGDQECLSILNTRKSNVTPR